MNSYDKQNKPFVLNLNPAAQQSTNITVTTRNLFSNPYIKQKVSIRQDLLEIYNQQDYEEDNILNKKDKSNSNSKQKYKNIKKETLQNNKFICKKHLKQYAHLFCSQCLSYNLCHTCIPNQHTGHQILQFNTQSEMINETKQILLQNLEQTLQQLKSKQNDVKNRVHQVNLIRNSLKTLQEDIVACISNIFRDIEGKLMAMSETKQQDFGKDLDHFFQGFNQVNDQLRQNLMNILDGKIDIVQFEKSMVCKEAPQSPNFQNYKNTLQKYKKILRDVKSQLILTKKIIDEGYQNIIDSKNNSKSLTNAPTKKFDKYIQTNLNKNQKASQSFIKTLKLIQNAPNHKQNGTYVRKVF